MTTFFQYPFLGIHDAEAIDLAHIVVGLLVTFGGKVDIEIIA